jgi:hypothetical protein
VENVLGIVVTPTLAVAFDPGTGKTGSLEVRVPRWDPASKQSY